MKVMFVIIKTKEKRKKTRLKQAIMPTSSKLEESQLGSCSPQEVSPRPRTGSWRRLCSLEVCEEVETPTQRQRVVCEDRKLVAFPKHFENIIFNGVACIQRFLYTLLTGTRAQEMCLFCVAWDEVKCGPTLKSRKQMKKWSYAVTKHTSQCYVYDRNTEHIITDSFKTRDTLRYTELVLVLLTVYVHPFCPP